MASKKKVSSTRTALEVGAALAAAGAAAATYYFYGDKSAKKHRQAATKWAKGIKADVLNEASKLKKLDRAAVTAIVNQATEAYQQIKTIDKKDLKTAAAELKKNWRMVEAEIRGLTTKKVAPKKVAKKAVKKTVKKG
jgi:uncharacterized protein HemX